MRVRHILPLVAACGRLEFSPLIDADAAEGDAESAAPPPLACSETRELGAATLPSNLGDREMSATATARGGIVAWNTSEQRLSLVALTLDQETLGVHGFGTQLGTSTNVLAMGAVAFGDDALVVAGTDSPSGTASAYLLDSVLAARGSPTTISLSTQERENVASWAGDAVVAGIANSAVSVARVSRDGVVLQQSDIAAVIPSEAVPLGLSSGAMIAYSIDAGPCELVRVDEQLAVIGMTTIAVADCDNPRLAYAPTSSRVLLLYHQVQDGDLLASFRDPDSLAELAPASSVGSGAQGGQLVWDGQQFVVAARIADVLFVQAFTPSGAPIAAAKTIASGVAARGYTSFAFRGAVYVPWLGLDGIMRLTRACP